MKTRIIGRRPRGYQRAFTRVEFTVSLAALALLALVVFPVLGNSRPRSARIICANNLRQIGAAMQLWGNDHNDQPPWEIPLADGGTYYHALAPNAWFHFAWMSNELGSAQILFCPSDTGRPARNFGNGAEDGYLHANFRNLATSYFLSHAFFGALNTMIAGDRNIGVDQINTTCSRFAYVAGVNLTPVSPNFRWNSNLHASAGNILRLDGRVEQLSNDELRSLASRNELSDRGDFQSIHLVLPR